MWKADTQRHSADLQHLTLHGGQGPLTVAGIVRPWREDPAFQAFWVETLQGVPFQACCREMPRLTRDNLDRRRRSAAAEPGSRQPHPQRGPRPLQFLMPQHGPIPYPVA